MRVAIASGKGGTGKTTVATSLASVLDEAGDRVAYLDCDVEEPNGHLFLHPEITATHQVSLPVPRVNESRCSCCRECSKACRRSAILVLPKKVLTFEKLCNGCGGCADACPTQAARMVATTNGEWFVPETRFGPMVHARLGIAEENSGKLVSLVRREARALAAGRGKKLLISDGSPGIGCPVIASLTGAQAVLIVSEPTLSGMHDMGRVAELARHFGLRGEGGGVRQQVRYQHRARRAAGAGGETDGACGPRAHTL